VHVVRLTYHALDLRALKGIQEGLSKKRSRGVLPRTAQAKNDKDVIAGWRNELKMGLLIFNVRPIRLALFRDR